MAEQSAMMQRNRMARGGRIDRSRECTFRFNNKYYKGFEGDSLAAALLANGIDVVGRSFKYSRPRGILAAGVEEPNAIMQLGSTPATQTPNVRATEQPLYDGLVCSSVNGWPSANNDAMSVVGKAAGAAMGPGFYYKTFMFPSFMWETYEGFIRLAAGLGKSSRERDPDIYDHMNHHVDVMVVGAGPAGLSAALSASRSGARVMIADDQREPGGALLYSCAHINGNPAMQWVDDVLAELDANPNVMRLRNAVVNGYHDHNFLTVNERLRHNTNEPDQTNVRERLHKVRAASVVLATGAHERPLVYANNDVPGCMLCSAVSQYINRYAVVPGDSLVVMTTNDSGYQAALDWHNAGRRVVAIVDTRTDIASAAADSAQAVGIRVVTGSAVIEVKGGKRVRAALVAPINKAGNFVNGDTYELQCDTVASSGGWSPVVHLSCHTGSKPIWCDDVIGFVPGATTEQRFDAGSVSGHHALSMCLDTGTTAGLDAARAALPTEVHKAVTVEPASTEDVPQSTAMPLFLVPHLKQPGRAPKQFVDMQNDVTAAGIQVSTREGFESIEHVKRYTAMGFGTDQGKTGNVNGVAIVAKTLGQGIADTGTTVFRPNYTPVTYGAVAGSHVGALFDPQRFTPMHRWHLDHGAAFENVGQWKRPWYFPRPGESMQETLDRECLATRNGVGILDASTLGKIDIQGKDAREFLGRVYTNAWQKLAQGKCRYGLMCGEDGMVMDDGVTSCLADNHFLMTTTTGGAASVLNWLELYHQTEWPSMEVYFNSVTDHWATMSIAGPKSRQLLAELCHDIDLEADAFGFMEWRAGSVAGAPARVYRISFTGDLSFEINVPAHYGMHVWQALFDKGERYGLTPYGTESMHILRAEKGFIIVGQDTDGSVTPVDINHQWALANQKPFSYIGKRGMAREDCLRPNRKQLVGLKCSDPDVVIPEGAQAVRNPNQEKPMSMVGHVTSSYYSAYLGRSIAMGVIRDGLNRMGEKVYFPMADGRVLEAEICSTVWLDAEGKRHKQ